MLSSYTNAKDSGGRTTLVADHAMSITGYDSSTGMLEIRNPWGTALGQYWDTTFEVSLATLLSDGDTITADNLAGATPSSSIATVAGLSGSSLSSSEELASLLLPHAMLAAPGSGVAGSASADVAWIAPHGASHGFLAGGAAHGAIT